MPAILYLIITYNLNTVSFTDAAVYTPKYILYSSFDHFEKENCKPGDEALYWVALTFGFDFLGVKKNRPLPFDLTRSVKVNYEYSDQRSQASLWWSVALKSLSLILTLDINQFALLAEAMRVARRPQRQLEQVHEHCYSHSGWTRSENSLAIHQ